MTDRDALYRSICAHPDDDTPRLVYADWLEENGRAEEAEFTRIECRLHADVPDDTDLMDRHDELRLWLKTHTPGPKLRFPAGLKVADGAEWWDQTRRGFPCFLEFEGVRRVGLKPIRALAAALQKAFETLPTRWLVVRFVTVGQLAELLKQPVIAGLDLLTIQLAPSEEPRDEVGRLLADCRHLRNLRGLALAFSLGPVGVEALARSEFLGKMRQLVLDPAALTPISIHTLMGSEWFRGLFELSLNDNCPADVFEELCAQEPLPNLHLLDLTDNDFPETSWRAFGRSRAFPALAELNLAGTDMSGGRFASFAAARWYRPTAIQLGACAIGNDGAMELARSPWVESLLRLYLNHNNLGPAGATAIARCSQLSRLKHLSFGSNMLGPSTLRAIAANPALRGLTSLKLDCRREDGGGLEPTHFRMFLSKLNPSGLRHLNLSGQPVGHEAARLLSGEKFRSLTRLNLSECKLTDAGLSALLSAAPLQNLIEFEVARNGLRTGVRALVDRLVMPQLSLCDLGGNPIPPDLARQLKRRPGIVI